MFILNHPDFKIANTSIKAEDLSNEELLALIQSSPEPIRDFEWKTKGKNTPFSAMDRDFMLKAAAHIIYKAELYHKKVAFYVEILEILQDHATHKFGMELPESADECNAMLSK